MIFKRGKIISLNKVNVVKKFSFSLRAEVEEWNWVYLQCVFKGVQASENRSLVGWVWMATERPRIGRDLWESVIPYETLLKYFKKDWKRHSTSTRFSLRLESQEKSAKFVIFNLYIIYRARSTRREVSPQKVLSSSSFYIYRIVRYCTFSQLFMFFLARNRNQKRGNGKFSVFTNNRQNKNEKRRTKYFFQDYKDEWSDKLFSTMIQQILFEGAWQRCFGFCEWKCWRNWAFFSFNYFHVFTAFMIIQISSSTSTFEATLLNVYFLLFWDYS